MAEMFSNFPYDVIFSVILLIGLYRYWNKYRQEMKHRHRLELELTKCRNDLLDAQNALEKQN